MTSKCNVRFINLFHQFVNKFLYQGKDELSAQTYALADVIAYIDRYGEIDNS